MFGICRHTTSADLADHQRGRHVEGKFEEFPLTKGRRYEIYGMTIVETTFIVLVRDDWGGPMFCPAGLFDIDNQDIPPGWKFALREGIRLSGRELWTRPVADWGYPELIDDPGHAGGLGEREPRHLEIFARYCDEAGEVDRPEGYTGPWPGWPTES